MLVSNTAVCDQHRNITAECFYCDLTEEKFWKEKYFKMLKQHMATVKELYELEEMNGRNT
jgi:hypothetical protein